MGSNSLMMTSTEEKAICQDWRHVLETEHHPCGIHHDSRDVYFTLGGFDFPTSLC